MAIRLNSSFIFCDNLHFVPKFLGQGGNREKNNLSEDYACSLTSFSTSVTSQ